jgi:hypothetical protein
MKKPIYPFLLISLLFFLGMLSMPTHAQEEMPITYERYDVEIDVATDGSFRVREVQRIRFNGTFRSAFAEIPLAYTSNITDVMVYEGETPYEQVESGQTPGTYSWENTGSTILVDWNYERTRSGMVKSFVLEYTVEGGLWVYDDEYILEWRAIPGDRSGITVENSSVLVRLANAPQAEELRYTAYGADYEATAAQGQVNFTLENPLPDGPAFQVLVAFPKAGITAEAQPYQLEEENAPLAYRFESLDVEMFIQPNGQVIVEEAHRLSVLQGLLRRGERTIPLAYTDGITNVQVFEGDVPLNQTISLCDDCFTVAEVNRDEWIYYDEDAEQIRIYESRAGEAEIAWQVPALVPGEATTFRLRYEVPGLIISDTSEQRFDWNVVFDTRRVPEGEGERVLLQSAPDIESATVRLHLPNGVSPEQVTIEGGTAVPQSDGTVLLTHEGVVAAGETWEIQVHLPPNATTAPVALWQQDLEAARQAQLDAAARFAQQQFGLGAGGVITLVGGLVGTLVVWFARGRDKAVPIQADYLSEPPSTLPPGIVAYLVDEEPTTKGVMASLFHLATLGIVQIIFNQGQFQIKRNLTENELDEGEEITRPDGTTTLIPRHLVMLYNAVAPHIPTEAATWMSNVYPHFVKVLPQVYEQMGQEASQFFSELPTKAEFRWKSLGQGLILVGLVALTIAYFGFREPWGDVVLWIPAALAVVGIAFWVVSRWMAQKTTLGTEEASKWEAFKRYLQNLKQYGSVAEAQTMLDDHFAYAVALDVEKVLLQQATQLGTNAPIWTYPTTVHRDGPLPSRDTTTSRPVRLPPLRTMPNRPSTSGSVPSTLPERDWSVQGASDGIARAITDADNSLAGLLNRAGGVDDGTTPFDVVRSGVEGVSKTTFSATKTTFEILGEILESSSTGGGRGGYSSGGSSYRSSSRGSSSWSRSSSSSSSSRSSSSRRSGGGGSRGFR